MQEPTPSENNLTGNQANVNKGEPEPLLKGPVPWWDHEDFPYSAPWWLRYPSGLAVFTWSYYAYDPEKKFGWLFPILLAIIALGLLRELFLAALLAVAVGLGLWAFGAAVAALPVSIAIIIGAMIIAQSMRR